MTTSFKKTWLLEKYARFVPGNSSDNSCIGGVNLDRSEKGEWKYFCTSGAASTIKVAIVAPLNLLITSGESVVLESFSLLGNEKDSWIKAICKGDSMLFLYKIKGDARRFRIKFAGNLKTSSVENCLDFVKNISKYIPVKTVESDSDTQASQSMLMDQSQTQLNSSVEYDYKPTLIKKSQNFGHHDESSKIKDAQIFATQSVRQIAEVVMQKSGHDTLPGCYNSTNIKDDANLDAMVKSCLMDPNFPAFVGQVEQSLKTLISS